ncbi:MAG: response regulator [Proteobacteria bacterium]|nr:response regulator [Pseudomonadota bacterium]
MHILVVEDDPLVARGVAAGLRMHGLTVYVAANAAQADAARATADFDVCVLDLALPDRDGMTLLQDWRRTGIDMPVLVLTARDAVEHRVNGLQAGADDYLLKPFDLSELVARLHALTRRARGRSTDQMVHGAVRLSPSTGEVSLHGARVELPRRELALLRALMERPGHILSAAQLNDSLYGLDGDVESNALKVHVHHLRRKLGADVIETVRGIGYRLGSASGKGQA